MLGGFYFCYTIFGANNSVLSTKIERKLIVEMWMSVLVQNLSGLAICKDQVEIDLQRKNFFKLDMQQIWYEHLQKRIWIAVSFKVLGFTLVLYFQEDFSQR